MAKFDSTQVFKSGSTSVTVERHEKLENRTWNLIKLIGFCIAIVAIAAGVFYLGRNTGEGVTHTSTVPAPASQPQPIIIQPVPVPPAPAPTFPSKIDVDVKCRVDASVTKAETIPPPTCEDVCRRNNTGETARFCIVTRCRQ